MAAAKAQNIRKVNGLINEFTPAKNLLPENSV